MEIPIEKIVGKWKKTLKRRIRTLNRSLKHTQDKLLACQNWKKIYHIAELVQSKIFLLRKGEKYLLVEDWEDNGAEIAIELDSKLKPAEEVAKRFKQAQKLKKGLPFMAIEVKRLEEALTQFTLALNELEYVKIEEDLKILEEKYHLTKPQINSQNIIKVPLKPYFEYRSSTGISIWVGKNAAMNDKLTFHLANGNDLWLHTAEYPGSHVVIHLESKQIIDDVTMEKALQLALYHSKARRFKEGEVVYTQVKYVKRIGKEQGKVQISNEKRVFVRYNSNLHLF